jgi:NADPH-dependent ferric siderophore reductase
MQQPLVIDLGAARSLAGAGGSGSRRSATGPRRHGTVRVARPVLVVECADGALAVSALDGDGTGSPAVHRLLEALDALVPPETQALPSPVEREEQHGQ